MTARDENWQANGMKGLLCGNRKPWYSSTDPLQFQKLGVRVSPGSRGRWEPPVVDVELFVMDTINSVYKYYY